MLRFLAAFSLLLPLASLRAATPQVFPDNYKPSPCVVKNICATFSRADIAQAGARMQAYTGLRQKWIDAHWEKLTVDMQPYCAKLTTCYATPGNTNMFCNDVVLTQAMSICDQFSDKADHEQCFLLLRTYASGIDLKSWKPYAEAQACGKANLPATSTLRKLDVTMTPAAIPPDFNGKLVVYALDSETHIPMRAFITVEGEILYARDVPDGRPTTSYALPWKAKLRTITDAHGRREVAAPMVKIEKEGYETITFPMPIEMRAMKVEMTPPPEKLKRGKNTVTITAVDPVTGKPVDARVLVGRTDVAEANQPFELELKRGEKRGEILVRSSFSRYSDVVVAPPER